MKKFILSLLLMFTCLSVSACSTFVGEDESLVITNVKQVPGKNDQGEEGFFIIIEYGNDDRNPDKFFVPNGKQGEVGDRGNGIKEIKTTVDEVTKETTITIYFTDEELEPVEYKVPIGLSMKQIHTEVTPTGDTKVKVEFSDGSFSEEFILPHGEKGDGIVKIEVKDLENDAKELQIYVTYQEEPIKVLIPRGKEGNGISQMVGITTPKNYMIQILYSNGKTEIITFDRPSAWLNGIGSPAGSLGLVGDFYYDIQNNEIFTKVDTNKWESVIKIDANQKVSCKVTFHKNIDPANPEDLLEIVRVEQGSYFGTIHNFPDPGIREGYEFKGWYLKSNPGINNGQFTDMTIVNGDIDLYAKWEKIK